MYPGEKAAEHQDRAAIIMASSGQTVTYREYEAGANRMAQLLRHLGLRRGDHVAIFTENHPLMLEAEGGADRTGLHFTCINSHLSAEEVAYIANDCEAQLVVSSAARRDVAAELPAQCPKVRRWLMIDGTAPGWESYEDAVAGYPDTPIADEQLGAAMMYSSGTTGQPKGIVRDLPDQPPTSTLALLEGQKLLFGLTEDMVYLSPAPLYHAAPQAAVAISLRLGATAVVMEKFDAEHWLQLVERHQVTNCQMVPTMFSRLLKLPDDVRTAYDVSSLRGIVHAAAPCPVPVKEAMIEWLGPIIVEYYASTEGNGFTFCTSEEWLAHKGTVGKPLTSELLILDDDEQPVPVGTPGTVWFRSAAPFEYFNAPEKTAEAQRTEPEGVRGTVGDVGYVDEDGYLYLTDRKSYMIISGGVNIYPQETENLLITHPKVMDAAVIGVPNADLGEEVKAVVQPMPDETPGPDLEEELITFCRDHLAHFKCPRSVDFEAELPRLPTGKLYKRLLRDRYWQGHTTTIL